MKRLIYRGLWFIWCMAWLGWGIARQDWLYIVIYALCTVIWGTFLLMTITHKDTPNDRHTGRDR